MSVLPPTFLLHTTRCPLGDMRGSLIVLSGSPTVPRAVPDRSTQVSWLCCFAVRYATSPVGRGRNGAHAVGHAHLLASEHGLRYVQTLSHQRLRALPHP